MGFMFFWKCLKFYEDFKNAIKFPGKVFGFLDNCIRIGCGKLFVLWQKNLSSVINVLTSRPNISEFNKREVFKLNACKSGEKYDKTAVVQSSPVFFIR